MSRLVEGITVKTRHITFIGSVAVTIMVASMLAAFGAGGTGTIDRPPRIAFVAHSHNPADALSAGPIAAQLGAPLFTTHPSGLSQGAADGLADFSPEIVVIVGGEGALPATIAEAIKEATGLSDEDIQRVAGADRWETAQLLSTLIDDLGWSQYFLPVDATAMGAVDADTAAQADHATTADSSTTAGDADTLDGQDSTSFAQTDLSMRYGPSGFVLLDTTSATLNYDVTITRIEPTNNFSTRVGIALDHPLYIGGYASPAFGKFTYDFARLTSLHVCYSLDADTDEISRVRLYEHGSSLAEVASIDLTGFNSTTPTCQEVPLPEGGVTSSDAVTLEIAYDMADSGILHTLSLSEVRAVWEQGTLNIISIP